MPKWTADDLKSVLADFTGPAEPTDPKAKKRRRILESARELFVAQGYKKTSIDEVARLAHVAKGTVYTYFPSKAHLLFGAVALEKLSYTHAIMPLLDDKVSPRERLKDWLYKGLVVSQEMPLVSKLMSGDRELLLALEELQADAPDLMGKSADIQRKFFGEVLREAHGDGWSEEQLQEHMKVLTGFQLFASLIKEPQVRQGLSLERFAELLTEMIVDGIAPSQRPHGADKESE
jgi:AcrR family transcriptional regulator